MGSTDYRVLNDEEENNLKVYFQRKKNSDEQAELFCFICLEKKFENSNLISCCSLCTACVHKKCWYTWRRNQKLSALRSKILGLNKLNPLLCTICKTGIAKIEEENDMNWIINNSSNKEYLQDELLRIISSLLNNEINDNHMPMLHIKYIFLFNFIFLILSIFLIILFSVVFNFSLTYVLLIALFILYEIIVLQIVLYLYIRIKYN
ncbi:conserved Plasmodium protein, unknown function [Plasmodium sp. DRC-Itaito]|nr:conserved Plasmodium protein, unknown function [Plasmodium sp. DRC-Itaito]